MRALALALLLALLPQLAVAQQWNDLISIEIEGLDHSMTRNGAPIDKPSSDGSASFGIRNGNLSGTVVANECFSQGRGGTINYPIKGGPLSGGGACDLSAGQYTTHVDYKWSSTAALNNGRLVLKGQGNTVNTTVRGCNGNWCGPSTVEYVEQTVLRLASKACTVESYSLTVTLKSSNGNTVIDSYRSNAKSRCIYN